MLLRTTGQSRTAPCPEIRGTYRQLPPMLCQLQNLTLPTQATLFA